MGMRKDARGNMDTGHGAWAELDTGEGCRGLYGHRQRGHIWAPGRVPGNTWEPGRVHTLVHPCGALYLPHYVNLDPLRNSQELHIIILTHSHLNKN